jgi:D-3-phosphoglycerate dehydrogenase
VIAGPPRVVFYDPIPGDWSYAIERSVLDPLGVELVVPDDEAEAERAVEDADVVIVTGVRRLGAEAIARLRRPAGLLCYSIGMDQVDAAAARERGIPVRNVPGYCTDEVADHALTLLLAAWRHLVPLAGLTAGAGWDAARASGAIGSIRRIRGRTLGILGAGRIGSRVGERARAFGLRTIAADPYAPGTDLLPVVPLEELLARADAIVCCAALTSASRGLLGADALSRVKPGLILVNVARGGLIDERALADALRDGRVAAAALDVRDPEPPDRASDPLAGLPNVIETPHIAASSQEAVDDLHAQAAEACADLLRAAGRLAA